MNTALRDTYNRIARDWHRDHRSDDWWVEGTDRFLSLLPERGAVLDVGCGAGNKSRYMADRGYQVTGIDFAEELLAIAREEAPQCVFRELAMQDLDLLDEQFDGVFAQASLLHIPKTEAPEIVRTMTERASPGGVVYLAVKESRDDKPDELTETDSGYGYTYERFFSFYTLLELAEYMRAAGLSVEWQHRSPCHPEKPCGFKLSAGSDSLFAQGPLRTLVGP